MGCDRFLFDQHDDEEMQPDDDLIGCAIGGRICVCVTCGKDDCIYRGSLREEVV